mgnify:CR=1 FL=1
MGIMHARRFFQVANKKEERRKKMKQKQLEEEAKQLKQQLIKHETPPSAPTRQPSRWVSSNGGWTQEQVETHVFMMFALLSQCHNIRRELCNGLRDQDVESIQTMFDSMGGHLNETFADLARQNKLIDDMRTNLKETAGSAGRAGPRGVRSRR